MPSVALRASFQVRAGIIPGDPITDYTRTWHYTSDDYEADATLPPMPQGYKLDLNGPLDQPHMSRFTRLQFESDRYMAELIHPNRLNWVDKTWIWYLTHEPI